MKMGHLDKFLAHENKNKKELIFTKNPCMCAPACQWICIQRVLFLLLHHAVLLRVGGECVRSCLKTYRSNFVAGVTSVLSGPWHHLGDGGGTVSATGRMPAVPCWHSVRCLTVPRVADYHCASLPWYLVSVVTNPFSPFLGSASKILLSALRKYSHNERSIH